jgi:hypothetical protein
MTVYPFTTDDEAVAIANDCDFGLGSSVFCSDMARARAIASRLEAGMTSINDFNATYMCQSLPFGGVKYSGFGRFGGIEGLRALCIPKVSPCRRPDPTICCAARPAARTPHGATMLRPYALNPAQQPAAMWIAGAHTTAGCLLWQPP